MSGFWGRWLLPIGAGHGSPPLGTVAAAELRAWMASGNTVLVDVREAEEHRRRCIPGAISVPLSRYPSRLATGAEARRVVFHCQSGRRTRMAGSRLAASTALPAYALAGGLDDWDQA